MSGVSGKESKHDSQLNRARWLHEQCQQFQAEAGCSVDYFVKSAGSPTATVANVGLPETETGPEIVVIDTNTVVDSCDRAQQLRQEW